MSRNNNKRKRNIIKDDIKTVNNRINEGKLLMLKIIIVMNNNI